MKINFKKGICAQCIKWYLCANLLIGYVAQAIKNPNLWVKLVHVGATRKGDKQKSNK